MESLSTLMNKLKPNEITSNIAVLIESIVANKKFSRLIVYSLSSLKTYLLQNTYSSLENCIHMVKCRILII